MRKITFKDRFRYHFDTMMSKGPIALIGWLFIASAILIIIVSLIVVALGIGPEGKMLDIKNRQLAQVTRADDFVVSDNLLSLMLSQISENAELALVFQDLFDPEGSEIYLKPAEEYVQMGSPLNFYTVVEAARRRNQVAIGYRVQADAYDAGKSYGVRINPKKSLLTTYAKGDRIIVLAED